MKARTLLFRSVSYLFLFLLGIIFLAPFYIVFAGSFKSYQEIFLNVFGLPAQITFENYRNAWNELDLIQSFGNSVIVSLGSILGVVIISAMAAYRIQRVRNRFHRTLYQVFVASMTIPFPAVMLPLLKFMSMLQLNNTRTGLILSYYGFGVALAVFLYHGFLKSVPRSIEEAAIVDGCSAFGVFRRIVFPLLRPTTITLVVLDVLWFWNDYMLPSIMLGSKKENRTIPLTISFLFDQFNSRWDLAMAAITLAIVPVLIIFIAFQKYIVTGISAGSVKG